MAPPRRSDVLVFGATGFTGRRVAAEVARSFKGTWAVAGRDRTRLEQLAASLAGGSSADNAPQVVVANVNAPDSLLEMAQSCRVLLNCVGPFRHWGEDVVKACVAAGTDYLDVCGEPEFIERMELLYDEAARAKRIYMASAVGFDSVPGDLGVAYTMSLFRPPARCTLVETALTLRSEKGFVGHFATYESAIFGFASASELRKLRKQAEEKHGPVTLNVPGPKPPRQTGAVFDPRLRAWTFPFLGADASVVRRSMQRLAQAGQPAANIRVVFTLPSRYYVLMWLVFGTVFQASSFLAARQWGRSLLLRFPKLFTRGLFSHEGPSQEQMDATSFTFTNIARGYSNGTPEVPSQPPDIEVVTRVSGPEPGYIACSIFIVQAAATVLEERQRLGPPGVHTPASLLRNTSYLQRLRSRGIKVERVEDARVQ